MANTTVNKVQLGSEVLIDISDTTAVASDVAAGKYFYAASGEKVAGTGEGAITGGVTQDGDGYLVLDDEAGSSVTVEALSVTQNGTYTAPTGTAYSPVTVNVSGGGGESSWTLLYSEDVQYANSTTTATLVKQFQIQEPYDTSRILWVSIRDTQGKRSGYYFGSDCIYLANDASSKYCFVRCVGAEGSGFWQSTSAAAYGGLYSQNPTFGDTIVINVVGKYNGTYGTGLIDSTYRISVYYVDYPSEVPPIGEDL